ncbi:hypothetical protein BJX63DRAFT_379471 [Aspergillus granulosus]|uniref:F-box domain-containing protein n=1 Tax=Aspergillus granulosus TaxID=176169 RepID=A0ABR4I2C1_9EURO
MATLLSLPLETLELISSHLTDHKLSLYAFSQATKRCAAASNIRFREITLRLSVREEIEFHIIRWSEILQQNSAFSSVRHLTISGCIAMGKEEQDLDGFLLPSVIVECDQGEDELTRRGEVYDDILRGRFYQLGVEEDQSDEPWKDFAAFLERLTGLKNIVWACERCFPQPLLSVLHGIPGCQLHVKAFDPPRLIKADFEDDETEEDGSENSSPKSGDVLQEGFVDEYEYRLATSPCLTSIVVPIAHDDPHREYNEEAVQWMVRSITPNLRHVHIIDSGPGFRYRQMTQFTYGRQSIRNKLSDEMGPGELESLSLDPANETRLESWESAIDFSHLCNLQLWRARKATLARAQLYDFSSLKSLALDVLNDQHSIDASPVDRAVGTFLKSLPPLDSLHLTGPWAVETFKAVLQHHGRALRKISLYPSENRHLDQFLITPRKIRLIGKHCPNLRDARLQVKRSAGDQEEQEIYQTVGALPKLRHLSLQLDIYNLVKVGLPMRSLEQNSEHVRRILINMAVDAKLAKEIACLIISKGRVETVILDLGINATGILGDIARYMKRRWKCVRIPQSSTDDGQVAVQEIGVERRKRRQDGEAATKLSGFTSAFASVWPLQEDSPSWRHAWHSFPLQRLGVGMQQS